MAARRKDGDQPPSYLRTAEVASLLHVSPKTVARWAKEGKLPFMKTFGWALPLPRGQDPGTLGPTPRGTDGLSLADSPDPDWGGGRRQRSMIGLGSQVGDGRPGAGTDRRCAHPLRQPVRAVRSGRQGRGAGPQHRHWVALGEPRACRREPSAWSCGSGPRGAWSVSRCAGPRRGRRARWSGCC